MGGGEVEGGGARTLNPSIKNFTERLTRSGVESREAQHSLLFLGSERALAAL